MLTTETATRLPGPEWLRARRQSAGERFATEPMPNAKAEEWRYSPVGDIDLEAHSLVDAAESAPPEATAGLPACGGLAIVVNGHVVSVSLDDDLRAAGVHFGPAVDDAALPLEEGPDLFSLANLAFAPDPLILTVPDGLRVDAPIAVVNWFDAPGALVLPRLSAHVGSGAAVDVLAVNRSAEVESLVADVVEVAADAGARFALSKVQDLGRGITSISNHSARVGSQATVDESVVAVGGGYSRQRNDCRLDGRGGSAWLTALYYGDESQVLDFRTYYDHVAPDTTSNLLFKGVLDDHAKSVYTGMIRVHPDARGTNAEQTNRNLKLSEEAWAESVPNLEIENNDVRCAHASTMGPIDADHRFYLESRGVPPEVAERLIVAGFFEAAVERLSVGAIAPIARSLVEAKIEVPA